MEVKIGDEYWEHLEADLKAFAIAMEAFNEVFERLETQGLIVETMGSNAELERANKLAVALGTTVKFHRKKKTGGGH
jgi:hypothetical protein